MDSDLFRIISEEIRETRNLTVETRRMADEAHLEARAAMKKADAAWELVVITRNQVTQELAYPKLPWWKKLFGVKP